MSVASLIMSGVSEILDIPSKFWRPYNGDYNVRSPALFTSSGLKMVSCMTAKFLGRTATLLIAGVAFAIFLNIAAQTGVGSYLGVATFVATLSFGPTNLVICAGITTVIATGLLTSILIEKYV